MENTEKVVQNENNDSKQKKPYRNRMKRRFYSNKNRANTTAVKEKGETESKQVAEVSQKPQKPQKPNNSEKKPQHSQSVAKEVKNQPKPQKKPVQKEAQKETEPIDFVIGEFEDKGKKYAFKMIKRVYYIYEVAEESETELFKTADSKEAYNEWCKIKYPEKLKKGMI